MNFQAQALQDRFVDNILGHKRDGTYLDIGSCGAVSCNNTYAFEALGWKGLCIELDPQHNDSYSQRSCKYLNADALTIDYHKLLTELGAPKTIDYLSLDIDAASTEVLKKLPLDEYTFSVITIEHDFYIHGGRFRDEQRRILTDVGYILLCADVLVPIQHDTKPDCSFEDWWVSPTLQHAPMPGLMIGWADMKCSHLYPEQILAKF